MTAGQKTAATVAVIGAFVLMNQCDTDSVVNQPATNQIDQARLQAAWDDQDLQTQMDICASWWEDREMATDLFYVMAIKNGVEDAPTRSEVQVFFDTKCG